MNENDLARLNHMQDYAREAVTFLEGKARDALGTDVMLARAVTYSVGIIGEAASAISQETRNANPQIPWREAIAMRNFLFHAYFKVELGILWETVQKSLPLLIAELEKLLASENE